MFKETILCLFLATAAIKAETACKHYTAELVHMKNCGDSSSIVTIEDGSSINLNENCELLLNACISFKAFQTAILDIKVVKDGEVLKEGNVDLCEVSNRELCRMEDGETCTDLYGADLLQDEAIRDKLNGNSFIELNIEHENATSCIHAELKINPNNSK